jgi:ribosomal protein L37AE/L43A
MSVCQCGCGVTPKKNNRFAGPRCYALFRRQQVQNDLSLKLCATCDRKLLNVDVAQGCVRCRECRAKAPGRANTPRTHVKPTAAQRPFVTPPPPVASQYSWWVGLTRAQFAAEVVSHQFPPESGRRITSSPSGDAA